MKVFIVEDEEAAARGLSKALNAQNLVPIEIVGRTDSVSDSIKWLGENLEPDLIFMDVQLSDGISFKIFEKVEVKSPIIFCTAYDQYAIQAFQVNGFDYLLKPVDKEDVLGSLKKLKNLEARAIENVKLNELKTLFDEIKEKPTYKNRYLVKAGQKFSYVDTEQVAYFYTVDSIHYLKTFEGKKFQIDKTLDEIENSTDPSKFFRISRQCVIQVGAIASVENDYRRLLIHAKPQSKLPLYVSRQRTNDFKAWLDD